MDEKVLNILDIINTMEAQVEAREQALKLIKERISKSKDETDGPTKSTSQDCQENLEKKESKTGCMTKSSESLDSEGSSESLSCSNKLGSNSDLPEEGVISAASSADISLTGAIESLKLGSIIQEKLERLLKSSSNVNGISSSQSSDMDRPQCTDQEVPDSESERDLEGSRDSSGSDERAKEVNFPPEMIAAAANCNYDRAKIEKLTKLHKSFPGGRGPPPMLPESSPFAALMPISVPTVMPSHLAVKLAGMTGLPVGVHPFSNHPTTNAFANEAISKFFPTTRISRKPRGEKKAIPVEQKDSRYYERRKRNNAAAKKSRDARKRREDEVAKRAENLERENEFLRDQIKLLKLQVNSMLPTKAESDLPLFSMLDMTSQSTRSMYDFIKKVDEYRNNAKKEEKLHN